MGRPPENLVRAMGIMQRYFRALVEEMAEDIVAEQETFDAPCHKADNFLEPYAGKLSHVITVLNGLASFQPPAAPAKPAAPAETVKKPAGPSPGPEDFLCSACRAKVRRADEKCLRCGWTWK